MPTTIKTRESGQEGNAYLNTVQFDAINEPGCYLCNWSGHLLRVPDDAIKAGRSPLLDLIGSEPLTVSKISDDPFIQINKARMLAADHDLLVRF